MSNIAKELTNLSLEKRQLLKLLLQQEGINISQLPITPNPTGRNGVPLSFAQQRLWFLHQLEPNSPAYHLPMAIQLEGALQIDKLEQTLTHIAQRHHILRTTFPLVDGQPVQYIHEPAPIHLRHVNLLPIPTIKQSDQIQHLIHQETQCPFDLAQGPLWRNLLIQTNPDTYIFVQTMHHIIFDGWSGAIFFKELSTIYNALCQQQPYSLPPLTIQYADFSTWQREWLQEDTLEKQLTYWKQHLSGKLPVLNLPTDYPRPPIQTFNGARQNFTLPLSLTNQLKNLSQQANATLFMTLLAAFKLLLYHYTHQKELLVGISIANRQRNELEPLIGFFVNTLVLRTDLHDNPTFLQLLQQVQQTTLNAYDHQDLPFEHLVEALQPERDLSRQPIFQVMFELQNAPRTMLSLGDLSLKSYPLKNKTVLFDMDIILRLNNDQLEGMLEYNTDLFRPDTIGRFLQHYQNLLQSVVTHPNQPIHTHTIITATEKEQLLHLWNQTRQPHPTHTTFSSLFEAQVAQTPHAIAVVDHHQQITYQRLNQQINQIAHHLKTLGVGPDVIVALLMERNLDFLITMLAIMKAGGAYLPLDPDNPAHYLQQVLEQSQTNLIITIPELRPNLTAAIQQMATDRYPHTHLFTDLQHAHYPQTNPQSVGTATNLAYVIYTSGSTGIPKGAMLNHQGMINHLYAKINALNLSAKDKVAQTARQTFDISIWQFLAALLVGGQTHIFDKNTAVNPTLLLTLTQQHHITILEVVPSLLQILLDEVDYRGTTQIPLNHLRSLMLTGEALPPKLCQQWLQRYPHIPLINAYGPTECSDDVTHYTIDHPLSTNIRQTPIGKPICNTQLYILDQHWQPVPIGVIGELYVGGLGVGRGYLHNPRKTAESFIPNPFHQPAAPAAEDAPSARLYKTGDVVRYLPDGNIEFLGRVDHQVKVRGFRIELGEIETVLNHHPHVRQAILLAWQDQPENNRLIAYVTLNQPIENAPQHLRQHLKKELPDYMIPALITVLDTLPLNNNGKVDRKALPSPTTIQSDTHIPYIPPQNDTEAIIATIWQDILQHTQISIHDNFFDIGGSSLLIMRIHSQLRQQLNQDIPMVALFQNPTIHALAHYLSQTPLDKAQETATQSQHRAQKRQALMQRRRTVKK